MFERILKLIQSAPAEPEALDPPDAQLAIGTLLVRVAMADDAYLFSEVEQIDLILAKVFNLKPLDAAKYRAKCETLSSKLPPAADLARVVRDGVSYEQRSEIVDALWNVANADGFTHESEAEMVETVKRQLGIEQEGAEHAS